MDHGRILESAAMEELRVMKKDGCLEDEYEFKFNCVSYGTWLCMTTLKR